MPRSKWINKKNATTFSLVHRSQQDPKIFDEDVSQMVFKEQATSNQKIKSAAQLEEEYGFDPSAVRSNEGEAAMHGVYYDDTEYDYMQHMRDMGTSTEAVFVEAPQAATKQHAKNADVVIKKEKQSLEDAIREDSDSKNNGKTIKVQIPEDMLPSSELVKRTYQDQQDVPDIIKGFQPDMDPRLREVLEALDDEAYVDDEEDLFVELAKSGEASKNEFEATYDEDEFDFDGEYEGGDDGWGSDTTEKAAGRSRPVVATGDLPPPDLVGADETALDAAASDDWQREFQKFKKDTKKSKQPIFDDSSSIGGRTTTTAASRGAEQLSSLVDSFNNRKMKKKKIGSSARTATSGYSMSSSALHRTEGLTTLDDRFDKIEEEYAESDDDDDGTTSQLSTMSNVPERKDFDSILDDFLGSYNTTGKKQQRVRIGKPQTGMEQLDEIRKGLGKARLSTGRR